MKTNCYFIRKFYVYKLDAAGAYSDAISADALWLSAQHLLKTAQDKYWGGRGKILMSGQVW